MTSQQFFNGNIIDLEASGFNTESYPIEIGLVLGNGTSFEVVIKPDEKWTHWCEQAQEVHGLSRKYLNNFGHEVRPVCEALNDICKGQTLYTDAWVWDSLWLRRLYETAGMQATFTCSPLEYFLTEHHLEHWMEYKSAYSTQMKLPLHRALNDAKLIARIMSDEGLGQMRSRHALAGHYLKKTA